MGHPDRILEAFHGESVVAAGKPPFTSQSVQPAYRFAVLPGACQLLGSGEVLLSQASLGEQHEFQAILFSFSWAIHVAWNVSLHGIEQIPHLLGLIPVARYTKDCQMIPPSSQQVLRVTKEKLSFRTSAGA